MAKTKTFYKVIDPTNLANCKGLVVSTSETDFKVLVKEQISKDAEKDVHEFVDIEQAKAFIGGEFVAITEGEYDSLLAAFEAGEDPRSDAFAEKPLLGTDVSAPTAEEQKEMREKYEQSETGESPVLSDQVE